MGKASLSKKAISAAAIGLIILIGLVLVLTLARGREQEALKPGQFAADDFSVYNNKVQISLGDSEERSSSRLEIRKTSISWAGGNMTVLSFI